MQCIGLDAAELEQADSLKILMVKFTYFGWILEYELE